MERRALLGAMMSSVIFGLSFLFAKVALNTGIPPKILLTYRFLVAFLGMVVFLFVGKQELNLKGKPVYLLGLISLCQPIGYFIGESYGLVHSTAGFASMMIALIPIVTLGAGALFLKEYPSRGQVLFSLLSILGVLLLALGEKAEGRVTFEGILFLSMAVLCATGFNVISRYSAAKFSAFERTFGMFFSGCVFFFFLGFQEANWNLSVLFSYWSLPVFVSVIFLGILSSIVAFFLMNVAFAHVPLAKMAILGNLVPVISVVAGILFLGEPASLRGFFSLALVIIGVIGVQFADVKKIET